MTALITAETRDARIPALVDDYNTRNLAIGQRIVQLVEELDTLHKEWNVVPPELLDLLRQETWLNHPEWDRSNPRQARHVERIAVDWAHSLAILRYHPGETHP